MTHEVTHGPRTCAEPLGSSFATLVALPALTVRPLAVALTPALLPAEADAGLRWSNGAGDAMPPTRACRVPLRVAADCGRRSGPAEKLLANGFLLSRQAGKAMLCSCSCVEAGVAAGPA